jgi:hypothetical protein
MTKAKWTKTALTAALVITGNASQCGADPCASPVLGTYSGQGIWPRDPFYDMDSFIRLPLEITGR